MDKFQRLIVLMLVLTTSLAAYPMVALFTELNLNPRDPLYFETNYSTTYTLKTDTAPSHIITVQSIPISADITNCSIQVSNADGSGSATMYSSLLSSEGFWLNGTTISVYYTIFWFFIENPIQQTLSGIRGAHSPKNITLIDPFGFIGPVNATYLLSYVKYYIVPFSDISNQVSNEYDVISASGVKIGTALYDTTCGLCWKIEIYNQVTNHGMTLNFSNTNFLISRNRYWFTGTMLANFLIGWAVFFILQKRKKWPMEDVTEMVKLIFIGDFAFFLDGIVDIWYNCFLIWIFILHAIYLGLILLFEKRFWRAALIGGLELAMCGVMMFHHTPIDLVLTFSPISIAAFLALIALWAENLKEKSRS